MDWVRFVPPELRGFIPSRQTAADVAVGSLPGAGEAMDLSDAWAWSGSGRDALLGGNYGQAAIDYGSMLGALAAAAAPGVGARAMLGRPKEAFGGETYYHHAGRAYDEFDAENPNEWRGATYFSPDPKRATRGASAGSGDSVIGAAQTAPNIRPVKIAGPIYGRDPMPEWFYPKEITYGEYQDVLAGKSELPDPPFDVTKGERDTINAMRRRYMTDAYTEALPEAEWESYAIFDENGFAVDTARDFPLKLSEWTPKPVPYEGFEGIGYDAWAHQPKLTQKQKRDLYKKMGFSGVTISDEAGIDTVAVFNPREHTKSIFELVRKYGIAGAAAATGLSAARIMEITGQDDSETVY